ncbi:MAG TPA: triose-phosphate isomerase [Firmicutes bacterium]|nr:triose-phosphate isomerase [Bacillota bacterium]
MRRPLIAGNWKMFKTTGEARALVNGLKESLAGNNGVEVAFCPPFTALAAVAELVAGTPFQLGAQNLFWEDEGAYTGEISGLMLKDLGCCYVIIGHSERRQYFGETDEQVNKKVKAAFKHGLEPILCVGETLAQREAGETEQLVKTQVEKALAGVPAEAAQRIVIAYEPIWAIGTGRSSSGADAGRVTGLIRQTLAALYSPELAGKIRILYGGSVKPGNIEEFMAEPEIDGALVGGASLDINSFTGIVLYNTD